MVAAGVAVEVAARQPLEAGLVGDAALAMRHVGTQRQRARQRAVVQATRLAAALLAGGSAQGGGRAVSSTGK